MPPPPPPTNQCSQDSAGLGILLRTRSVLKHVFLCAFLSMRAVLKFVFLIFFFTFAQAPLKESAAINTIMTSPPPVHFRLTYVYAHIWYTGMHM
jgi:hypothetical protein